MSKAVGSTHRGLGIAALAVAVSMIGCLPVPNVCPDPVAPGCDPAAPAEAPIYLGSGNVYERGPLAVSVVQVAPCEVEAPMALRVHVPQGGAGPYAVVVFQHGFMSLNLAYDGILSHLASHGFVVVAPQMYSPGLAVLGGDPNSSEEAELTGALLDWIPCELAELAGVEIDVSRTGIAGHSRGGKVAWRVLADDPSRATAVAGVDPVDGSGFPPGADPRVVDGPFDFDFPSLVIGAGQGGACSPIGDNHEQFYAASASPAWHVVAPEAGHTDMLDDLFVAAAGGICPAGTDVPGTRRLTAGLLTAFFRGSLQGDAAAYAVLSDAAAAPVPVEVESK